MNPKLVERIYELFEWGRVNKDCEHCQAPIDRRAFLSRENLARLTPEERISWCLASIVDQVAFKLKMPRHSELPIPVVPGGMGCLRVAFPIEILSGLRYNDLSSDWVAALNDFRGEFSEVFRTRKSDALQVLTKEGDVHQSDWIRSLVRVLEG